jgi:hypothetical protein
MFTVSIRWSLLVASMALALGCGGPDSGSAMTDDASGDSSSSSGGNDGSSVAEAGDATVGADGASGDAGDAGRDAAATTVDSGNDSGFGSSSGADSGSSGAADSGSRSGSGSSSGSGPDSGSSSGADSGGTGMAIVPDPNGYVGLSRNTVGIQGPWYGYGDCWGTNGAPPGDCENKGGHPIASCSTITFPTPATASDAGEGGTTSSFTQTTPGTMCLSGIAAMVIGADFTNMFGIGIGLGLNNPGGVEMAYDAPTNKVIGFSFHLAGVPTGGIRVEFPTTDTNTVGKDAYSITVVADGDCTADLTTDAGDAHRLTPAFVPNGFTEPAFMANHLLSVQFHVATTPTAAIPVANLCVSNFQAIVGP